MADQKISALTAATTPLAGTEVLPIVQSGATKKVAVSDLTAGRATSASAFSATRAYANTSDLGFVAEANIPGWNLRSTGGGRLSMVTGYIASDISSLLAGTGTNNPGTEVMRVTHSTGAVNFISSDVTLQAGNLIQGTASKGVNFTANTPAAGMTSQLLNWYEEGTWTATLNGTVANPTTPVTVTGKYTRVGRQVTVTAYFAGVDTTGASGSIIVTGLPFTSSGASFGVIAFSGFGTAAGVSYVPNGANYILPSEMITLNNIAITAGAGRYLAITHTYFV